MKLKILPIFFLSHKSSVFIGGTPLLKLNSFKKIIEKKKVVILYHEFCKYFKFVFYLELFYHSCGIYLLMFVKIKNGMLQHSLGREWVVNFSAFYCFCLGVNARSPSQSRREAIIRFKFIFIHKFHFNLKC